MVNRLLEDKRTLWIIGGVSLLLFLIGNLPWELDNYDQAKQAFTSFQMVKEGRWLYQETPHEHLATKPPLIGWISAVLFSVTRSWDTAWRLPSLLSAVAVALLLFRAATSAYGSTAGIIALGAFGLNLLSPRLATLVRTDMPLALVIFLIGLLIWQKIREQGQWRFRDQVYVFALLTAAMLIKGPIVYAFLLPGIVMDAVAVALWTTRTLGTGRRLQTAWPGWWPWIASLAVFLLWVAGGIAFQAGFFDEVVMREFVARFSESVHRPQPMYFYVPHLLQKFAPWSVLMIVIALAALQSHRWRMRSMLSEMSPDTLWLLCWTLGGLIVMSLIPSKRVDRIFPVIPPLCLLVAAQISSRASRRNDVAGRDWCLVVTLAIAVVFTGGYTIWKVCSGYREHRDALATFGKNVRREAEAKHWRYEVVSARDEGLLLYLQRTHFTEPDEAVTEWNTGNVDALIASTEKAPVLMRDLQGANVSQFKSSQRQEDNGRGYVLITR